MSLDSGSLSISSSSLSSFFGFFLSVFLLDDLDFFFLSLSEAEEDSSSVLMYSLLLKSPGDLAGEGFEAALCFSR